jgi:hypothetical protein
MRVFLASMVAFVGLSVFADRGAVTQRVTGTVTGLQAGEWISVGNEQNPQGFPIALRETTAYDPAAIKPGVRVTVWYKSVGERRSVADKVRVLTDAEPPAR